MCNRINAAVCDLTFKRAALLLDTQSQLLLRIFVRLLAWLFDTSFLYLKKKQNTPRPSEHPPVMGGEMSKRLGGIKGCKYKTSSWHLNRFPDAGNIGSTV